MFYYIAGAVLVAGMLYGLAMMNKVETAKAGNRLGAACVALAILLVLFEHEAFPNYMLSCIAVGFLLGSVGAAVVKMTQMPQAVALLNGFGACSALVAWLLLSARRFCGFKMCTTDICGRACYFTGSLVAAGKLAGLLPRQPVIWKGTQYRQLCLRLSSFPSYLSTAGVVWLAAAASALLVLFSR